MTPRRNDATLHVSRRDFLRFGAIGLLGMSWNVASWRRGTVQDTLPGAGPAGRLADPARAGRSIEPVTAKDNLAAIQQIEKQLRCTCGCNLDIYTCRTTDFSCTVSPALHRQVLALYEGGRSEPEIIDAFVAEHGQAILMAPPKRGFNLLGYFVPGVVVLGAAVLLTLALRRWTRAGAIGDARPIAGAGVTGSAAELERLRAELDQIDA